MPRQFVMVLRRDGVTCHLVSRPEVRIPIERGECVLQRLIAPFDRQGLARAVLRRLRAGCARPLTHLGSGEEAARQA